MGKGKENNKESVKKGFVVRDHYKAESLGRNFRITQVTDLLNFFKINKYEYVVVDTEFLVLSIKATNNTVLCFNLTLLLLLSMVFQTITV